MLRVTVFGSGLHYAGKKDARLFTTFLMLLRDDADCSHRAAPIHDQPPFKTGLPLIELSSVNMRNEMFCFQIPSYEKSD